jgi:hypothetical protein
MSLRLVGIRSDLIANHDVHAGAVAVLGSDCLLLFCLEARHDLWQSVAESEVEFS